jgi:hypothetical protein
MFATPQSTMSPADTDTDDGLDFSCRHCRYVVHRRYTCLWPPPHRRKALCALTIRWLATFDLQVRVCKMGTGDGTGTQLHRQHDAVPRALTVHAGVA